MSFIDLSMLKRVAHESVKVDAVEEKVEPHPMLSHREVPQGTRILYLQGCVLAAMLNNGDIDAKSKAKLVRLGKSLELELKDVNDCILSTARLGENDQGKEELVRKLIKDLSGDFFPKFFIKDFEDNLLKVGGELTAEMSEYLDYFGQALFGCEDWRESQQLYAAFKNKNHAEFVELISRCKDASVEICRAAVDYYKYGKKDLSKAAYWLERAAEKGDAKSQLELAVMYENGSGVERNGENAVKWYRFAAEQGEVKAQNRLGRIFKFGECDTEVDYTQAKFWLCKAVEQGDRYAGYWLKNIDTLIEQYNECVAWFCDMSKCGGIMADAYRVASLYWRGEGAKADYWKSLLAIKNAAEQGDATAQYALGLMYEYGKGVKLDEKQRIKWFLVAAQSGNEKAQRAIASHYYSEKQYDKSLTWYRKLASNGDLFAMRQISFFYYCGEGVERDVKQTIAWLKNAAEGGSSDAMYDLSDMYCDEAVKDEHESLFWLRKAAENGHQQAQKDLEERLRR